MFKIQRLKADEAFKLDMEELFHVNNSEKIFDDEADDIIEDFDSLYDHPVFHQPEIIDILDDFKLDHAKGLRLRWSELHRLIPFFSQKYKAERSLLYSLAEGYYDGGIIQRPELLSIFEVCNWLHEENEYFHLLNLRIFIFQYSSEILRGIQYFRRISKSAENICYEASDLFRFTMAYRPPLTYASLIETHMSKLESLHYRDLKFLFRIMEKISLKDFQRMLQYYLFGEDSNIRYIEEEEFSGDCFKAIVASSNVPYLDQFPDGLKLTVQDLNLLKDYSELLFHMDLCYDCVNRDETLKIIKEVISMNRKEKASFISDTSFAWKIWDKIPPEKLVDVHPNIISKSFLKHVARLEERKKDSLWSQELIALSILHQFFNETEVNRYIKKWFSTSRNPIHDAGQLPFIRGQWTKNKWKDLLLKFGPNFGALLKYAPKIELEGLDVPTSLKEMRKLCSKFCFSGVKTEMDHRIVSALTLDGTKPPSVEQRGFEDYKKLCSQTKSFESIPFIHIKDGKWEMVKLDYDDPIGPMLGLFTNCCQHLDGVGHECARDGWESGFSGFYVVKYKGRIVAQSWAWRSKDLKVLCFDNIEMLGDTYEAPVVELYKLAAKKIVGRLGIKSVTVGLGYDDLPELTSTLESVKNPPSPKNYDGYTDAKEQKLIYGEMPKGKHE